MFAIYRLDPRMLMAFGGVCLFSSLTGATNFEQVNLVTDNNLVHSAVSQDANLVNAWGVSYTPSSPFWISDNGTGHATLYQVNPLTDTPTTLGLVVTIPGSGNPTGQAFNPLSASGAFNHDNFLFVSEDGTISGWRNTLGTSAETLAVGSVDNAYTGTTFGTVNGHGYLYSANFHTGSIDILKGDVAAPDLAANFIDPNLPSGYAPFNIRNLGDKLYVTYALQDGAKRDAVAGAGNGIVDVFDLQGNFIGRIATQGSLNSPWGLEIAPASFGALAGDLLVGNFGDGTINAFDMNNNVFEGQLSGVNGNPVTIDGLWALTVGNDGSGGSSEKLYFTAGPDNESHGLFGVVAQVPDSGSTLVLLLVGIVGSAVFLQGRKG